MLMVVQVVGVAVTNLFTPIWRWRLLAGLLLLFCQINLSSSGVLPDERADLLYHSYDGGGVQVTGPSLLVRKNTSTNTSVFYNYYVDHISSASLDVLLGGSPYTEQRREQSLGVDYLHGRTRMSLAYTNSAENDYNSGNISFNLTQDFFGDLSTLVMGYSQGTNDVGKHTPTTLNDPQAVINHQNYRVGFNQIFSKNLTVGLAWETITDEGHSVNASGVTLGNPYRSYSYCSADPCVPGSSRQYAQEIYPNTHTSNALAVNATYYLSYRAAVHAGIKFFQDDWGVDALTYNVGYTHPKGSWIFDFRARWYSQSQADFYSDLFDYANQYTFMARDKELSTFQDFTVGMSATWEFAKGGWGWIDKGTLNLSWDHIEFSYDNYRDATAGGTPGSEPLYSFGADVFQFFVSFWY